MPSAPDTDALELAKLASDASLRALAEQERALRDLRLHAGTLVATAAIVATFLGSEALVRQGSNLLSWLAMGAFFVTLVASLRVLAPAPGLRFALDGVAVAAGLDALDGDQAACHWAFAQWTRRLTGVNERAIARVRRTYRTASVVLVVQVALWMAHLAI